MSNHPALSDKVQDAYERWTAAVTRRDHDTLQLIHGDEFVYTGIDGRRMSRDEHIAVELNADVEPQKVTDLIVEEVGDAVVSSGKHNLHGNIDHELTSGYNSRINSENLTVAFTTVWKSSDQGLRVWAMHLSLFAEMPSTNIASDQSNVHASVGRSSEMHTTIAQAAREIENERSVEAGRFVDQIWIGTNEFGERASVDSARDPACLHLAGRPISLEASRYRDITLAWGTRLSPHRPDMLQAFTQLWRHTDERLLLSASHVSDIL